MILYHQFPTKLFFVCYRHVDVFGGLEVACWPLVPKFAGSNPAEAVGFLGRKNRQPAFLRRGSKAVVPCRRFAACKRSLNLGGSRNLGKITTGHLSCPQFHLSLIGCLASLGRSKGGGKQWQTIPKNLSRMQCAKRHIVSITGLWFLPDRPLGLNINEHFIAYFLGISYNTEHKFGRCTVEDFFVS